MEKETVPNNIVSGQIIVKNTEPEDIFAVGSTPNMNGWGWFQTMISSNHPHHGGIVDLCVRRYAQLISQMPMIHEKQTSDGVWEEVNSSTYLSLLNRPNEVDTYTNLISKIIADLLNHGEFFVYVGKDRYGRMDKLVPLQSRGTSALVAEHEGHAEIVYQAAHGYGKLFDVPYALFQQNVIHGRIFPNEHDMLRGRSPIEQHMDKVHLGGTLAQMQAAFYKNALVPSGFFTKPSRATKEQIAQFKLVVEQATQGENAGGTMVLPEGWSFNQTKLSGATDEAVAAIKLNKAEIAGVFGIPLRLLDQSGDDNADIESLIAEWLTTGVSFYTDVVQQSFNNFFGFDLSKQRIRFQEDAAFKNLQKDIYARMGEAVSTGVLTPNEARRKLGRAPKDGGDSLRMQQQYLPLDADNPQLASADKASDNADSTGVRANVEQTLRTLYDSMSR